MLDASPDLPVDVDQGESPDMGRDMTPLPDDMPVAPIGATLSITPEQGVTLTLAGVLTITVPEGPSRDP
jgi:hypothetical protein